MGEEAAPVFFSDFVSFEKDFEVGSLAGGFEEQGAAAVSDGVEAQGKQGQDRQGGQQTAQSRTARVVDFVFVEGEIGQNLQKSDAGKEHVQVLRTETVHRERQMRQSRQLLQRPRQFLHRMVPQADISQCQVTQGAEGRQIATELSLWWSGTASTAGLGSRG